MALPWVASVLKWLGHAQYNSTPPTLAESEVSALQCDGSGNLKVSVVSGGSTIEFAQIGSTVRAYWDQSAAAAAVIQGYVGTFTDPSGSTFDITLGAGSPITVTPQAGDTSASAIVSRINGTSGLSGVASVSNGAVKVAHATKIVVSGVGNTLFQKIGIPNMTRDRSITNGTSIQMPVEIAGTELELVSKPITVPAGANRVSIVAGLTPNGSDVIGGEFAIGWANGIDGETISALTDVPFVADLASTVANRSTDNPFGQRLGYIGTVQLVGGSVASRRLLDLPVPPGATKLYLVPLVARSQSDVSTPPRSRTPPSFSATVAFASR